MTSATQTDSACPCGSARPFDHCCGPLLEGRQPAPTAEALMRSRYTAYTRGAIDYVIDTHDPERRGELNPAFMTRWSRESDWLGLEIVRTEAGGERDSTGVVEFRAHFRSKADRVPRVLHEVSRFRRQHAEDGEGGGGGAPGRWVYVDGDAAEKVRTTPVVRTAPKVGRNDPCPCGSGRKYKKCCG